MGREKSLQYVSKLDRKYEEKNEKVNEQELGNITVLELKAALTKSQEWKSPVIDKVPNFWFNALSSSHVTFASLPN